LKVESDKEKGKKKDTTHNSATRTQRNVGTTPEIFIKNNTRSADREKRKEKKRKKEKDE